MLHGLTEFLAIFYDTGFDHFTHQIVPFAGTLTYTSEYGQTFVTFCDVVDQLLDQYGFTYTRTTKQTDLTTFCVRLDQVDHFNTGVQYFCISSQVFEPGRLTVNGITVGSIDVAKAIDCLTYHVEQASFYLVANRHFDSSAFVFYCHTPYKTVGRVHCHATNAVFTQVLLNFQHYLLSIITCYFQGVVDLG